MSESPRAGLWGGPFDGHSIAPRAMDFIWVSPLRGSGASDDTVRVHLQAGPHPGRRALYHRVDSAKFVFASFTHGVCTGCERPQWRKEVCSLCAQKLIPAARHSSPMKPEPAKG